MLRVKVGRRRAKGKVSYRGRERIFRAAPGSARSASSRVSLFDAYGINWDVDEARIQSAAVSRDMIRPVGK